jgi:type 1 glutamine amidotransferase
MIRFRDGQFVRDMTPKPAGHHGAQHAFQVVARQPDHPILKGLPPVWMHAKDEFYDSLRGPAENLDVIATGFSAAETGGTGENEPVLMTVRYGKGRTFHTILGHHVDAMRCVGFITTLQRGTEWAATGRVTQKVPPDFPGENEVKVR